ncbi:hypothetical protein K474DRAFT_1705835 [Panus rudis PR-1116 ss-1]|nr:hypothetical protein K474DRAFT_1705835 [Panus rudis PR-1116 ss-1]
MADIPTPAGLLGGFVIEVCFALILYGIITAQTYMYSFNSKEDPAIMKYTVASVWILETAHTVFVTHMLYHYTITNYGNLPEVGKIIWSAGASVFAEVRNTYFLYAATNKAAQMLIVMLVQGFYIRRVWILSGRSILLTFITGFFLTARVGMSQSKPSIVELSVAEDDFFPQAFGTATGGLTYYVGTWASFRTRRAPLFTLGCGLALSAVVDFLIAAILIFYLRKGHSGFKSTDGVIRSLMAYAVNTGAVTMLVSLVIVLTFVFIKDSILFAGFVLMASKRRFAVTRNELVLIVVHPTVYANSFLGTLNSRRTLSRNRTAVAMTSRLNGMAEMSVLHSQMHGQPRPIEIYQETSKITDAPYSPYSPCSMNERLDVPERRASVKFDTTAMAI